VIEISHRSFSEGWDDHLGDESDFTVDLSSGALPLNFQNLTLLLFQVSSEE
jgi:hypothetical protein